MKKHNINCFNVVMVLFFMVSSPLKAFAEDWDDGPDPPPPAPIDDYIYPAIVIALIAVLYFFYNKEYKAEKPLKQK